MAMGARGIPSRPPPRLIVGRVYEQFKPMSEWRQEDDHDTLLVYLPGFQKEYIKVTTEDVNTVRVRGERLVAGNKWSRFQDDFRVPENCDMRGIRARFDGGILTVTMPRKTSEPFRSRTRQEEALPKAKPKAALEMEKKPADRPPSPLKPTPAKQEALKKASPSSSKPLKTTTGEAKELAKEELKFGSLPTTSVPKHDAVEESRDKGKGVSFMGDKVEEKNKSSGVNEDRKLLVNVGVGVLVIVALGVHVSYNIK